MEALSEYVQRVMQEKNLRPVDVARNSDGGIGDSHVANIAKGTTTNMTLDKLKALALGLRVDPVELFKVAIGIEPTELNLALLGRVFEKLSNPELTKLLLLLDRLNEKQIKVVLARIEKQSKA